MNAAARLVPDPRWTKGFMLRAMGLAAQLILRTGRMNLVGRTSNGQAFIANPQQLWLVKSGRAVANGVDLGPIGPLPEQARLNEFLIPQRGVFAVARSFLERSDNLQSSRAGLAGANSLLTHRPFSAPSSKNDRLHGRTTDNRPRPMLRIPGQEEQSHAHSEVACGFGSEERCSKATLGDGFCETAH
jgi:hypothetical protein